MWRHLVLLVGVLVSSSLGATEATDAANVTRHLQRGTLPGPDKAQAKAANFDMFTLSAYYWPGHCATSQSIPKCVTMPPQWKSGLVVHGLWPGYSDAFKRANGLPATAQGPDGGNIKCFGTPYDKKLAPQPPADELVFPGIGVSNKSPDFHLYQWNKHGICAQMDQKTYWATAVSLGKAASAKFVVPKTGSISAADLQKMIGSLAQPTCFRNNKGQTVLWFVNYCYKRAQGVGGATACPGVSNCAGTITLNV
ncbi:hypothetical protein Poli38472_007205 [Pythium oligandrum]|uniref:Uncharacterized protein n=1 Tax=Pythium oligandrum TaxID=41045 RepID=A0A8K1CA29_PYTOL|nr:hypothetical protein Poli38472_007205 [Pythium oligandrum]|eukprot:TMW59060.1 hypothetical protein Poli38472_007205 [Pythium oligandrum]